MGPLNAGWVAGWSGTERLINNQDRHPMQPLLSSRVHLRCSVNGHLIAELLKGEGDANKPRLTFIIYGNFKEES